MDLGMCGKSSLKKLRTEGGWGSMSPASLEPLEQALTVLEEDLKSKKEEKKDMHRASVAAPNVWTGLKLFLHHRILSNPAKTEFFRCKRREVIYNLQYRVIMAMLEYRHTWRYVNQLNCVKSVKASSFAWALGRWSHVWVKVGCTLCHLSSSDIVIPYYSKALVPKA